MSYRIAWADIARNSLFSLKDRTAARWALEQCVADMKAQAK